MRLKRPSATGIVLALLCWMYLITYVDRVIVSTAASDIRRDLHLSTTQLGVVFSAFGYFYLLFQVFGGWVGDRLGPRLTLVLCGVLWASATIFTGFAGSLAMLFAMRCLLGLGEGATFPCATRAMQSWMSIDRRGFAQGITHAFARFGNAITPPIVAFLIALVTWRGSFITLGVASLVWVIVWGWYFRDDPADHAGVSREELERLPERGTIARARQADVPWLRLTRRMMPVTVVYFCYGWTLWLFLNWLPSFFLHEYRIDLNHSALFSSLVFLAGVGGDMLGGIVSDAILRRTGNVLGARRNLVMAGFLGSFGCMLPILATHALVPVVLCLAGAFFSLELVIGPMWAIPMDIAGKYSGTASGLMNTGSALASILSPLAFGVVADATGNWRLPFVGSLGLLVVGTLLAFTMHPEVPFEDVVPQPQAAQPVPVPGA